MHCRTALAAVQCSMLGFAMCLANTPIVCELPCDLGHTGRQSKLPTTANQLTVVVLLSSQYIVILSYAQAWLMCTWVCFWSCLLADSKRFESILVHQLCGKALLSHLQGSRLPVSVQAYVPFSHTDVIRQPWQGSPELHLRPALLLHRFDSSVAFAARGLWICVGCFLSL